MSNALFDDTLTLYLPSGESFVRRVIPTVRIERSEGEAGLTVTAYLPLHGRRALRYVAPEDFVPTRTGLFTVCVGARLIPALCREELPPSGAPTVTAVTVRTAGSRRLHHIRLTAKEPLPSSDTANGEESESHTESNTESEEAV